MVEEEQSCKLAEGESQKETPHGQDAMQTELQRHHRKHFPSLLLGAAFRPGSRGEGEQQAVMK